MVDAISGSSFPYFQSNNSGNVPGQEQDYISLLEVYLEIACDKGDISSATKNQLIHELSQINTHSSQATQQLQSVIDQVNQNNIFFPQFKPMILRLC